MGRREIELRNAMAAAWAAARITGGDLRRLTPVYADRGRLAAQVIRGRKIRRNRRAIVLTAILATAAGMAAGAAVALALAQGADEAVAIAQGSEPAPAKDDAAQNRESQPANQNS